MQNALNRHPRGRKGLRGVELGSRAISLLSLLAFSACVPPVDQELEPEERDYSPNTTVLEYTVSRVETGETLAEGCTALASNEYRGRLAERVRVAIPLALEYRVDIRKTSVPGTSDAPDAVARYCAMEDREPVTLHYPASCVTTAEPLLHELTAASVLDSQGNPVPDPNQGRFTYEEPATDRYQLVSHQVGRVVLDLSNGPCAPTEKSHPHDLFALLTVLEEASQ